MTLDERLVDEKSVKLDMWVRGRGWCGHTNSPSDDNACGDCRLIERQISEETSQLENSMSIVRRTWQNHPRKVIDWFFMKISRVKFLAWFSSKCFKQLWKVPTKKYRCLANCVMKSLILEAFKRFTKVSTWFRPSNQCRSSTGEWTGQLSRVKLDLGEPSG